MWRSSRRYPSWPAEADLCWEAAGGRSHVVRLQHSEGERGVLVQMQASQLVLFHMLWLAVLILPSLPSGWHHDLYAAVFLLSHLQDKLKAKLRPICTWVLIPLSSTFPVSGVNAALGAQTSWWRQKEEEEVLHDSKEEQAQEEEGQAGCAQILQGMHTKLTWDQSLWLSGSKFVSCTHLLFLQVDENGKIHRLRRECPADECGAGVFMASHFDRHYCGKCCLTYCFNKPEDK